MRKVQTHVNESYKYAIDLDLEKFFDTVNHSKLIEVLSRTLKDNRLLSLIHKYLNAGVVASNKFEETTLGVPQLLSNIMLNELDKELERRGHRFVRYADDCMILCKSKRAANRTKESIIGFIEDELFLKVNKEKTKVGYIKGLKFLGYSFYVNKGVCKLSLHSKSKVKLKFKLKELTSRSKGFGYERCKIKLKEYIQGWISYYKLADMKKYLQSVDEWLRRRLRMCIWKCWILWKYFVPLPYGFIFVSPNYATVTWVGGILYSLTKVQNFYLSGKQLVIKNQTISRRSLNNWFVVKKQR